MTRYNQFYSARRTPQSQPIPGRTDQVKNNAGGYVFQMDDLARFERFLILGSDSSTYYQSGAELTVQNAECALRLFGDDARGVEALGLLQKVSFEGRAARVSPALFALALAIAYGTPKTRVIAAESIAPDVLRTASHLMEFVSYLKEHRGWGKLARQVVADWYLSRTPADLLYQMTKYRQRNGLTHRDLLRLAHPKAASAEQDALFAFAAGKFTTEKLGSLDQETQTRLVRYTTVQGADDNETGLVAKYIRAAGLTHEMVPNRFLNHPTVLAALVESMPMTATIRQLNRITAAGLLDDDVLRDRVIERLVNPRNIRHARIHPFNVLVAQRTYSAGEGFRGSMTWTPDSGVSDALEEAFELAFGNVKPTGKRLLFGLDVSGSMGWNHLAGTNVTAREAAAALILPMLRAEKVTPRVMAFATEFIPVRIGKTTTLDRAVWETARLPMGGTDCALPMRYALEHNLQVDAFVVVTDGETWAGRQHPKQALEEYRRRVNPDAKLVVIGMTSTGFSIADPNDGGMLDVVGFDANAPAILHQFLLS